MALDVILKDKLKPDWKIPEDFEKIVSRGRLVVESFGSCTHEGIGVEYGIARFVQKDGKTICLPVWNTGDPMIEQWLRKAGYEGVDTVEASVKNKDKMLKLLGSGVDQLIAAHIVYNKPEIDVDDYLKNFFGNIGSKIVGVRSRYESGVGKSIWMASKEILGDFATIDGDQFYLGEGMTAYVNYFRENIGELLKIGPIEMIRKFYNTTQNIDTPKVENEWNMAKLLDLVLWKYETNTDSDLIVIDLNGMRVVKGRDTRQMHEIDAMMFALPCMTLWREGVDLPTELVTLDVLQGYEADFKNEEIHTVLYGKIMSQMIQSMCLDQ